MKMDIFEFYKFLNEVEIDYIAFMLCDEDGGSTFMCKSTADVMDILFDDISLPRLYRKEYLVHINEIKFK